MAQFCRFVNVDTQTIVWVNPEQIRFMRPDATHTITHIIFDEGHTLKVDGTIESTMKARKDADRT